MRRMIPVLAVAALWWAPGASAAGSAWTLEATPVPAGALSTALNGVACPRADACTAVGQWVGASRLPAPLAMSWAGGAWTLEDTPAANAPGSFLQTVSCPRPGVCTAVGGQAAGPQGSSATLVERREGDGWRVQPSPSPSGSDVLWGVSCGSPRTCVAVGQASRDGVELPLALSWRAGAWRVQTVPLPAGATQGTLYGASCPNADHCTAVGSFTDASGNLDTLAERLVAGQWQLQPTPNPSGSGDSGLRAVSCPALDVCVAVGDDVPGAGTGNQALIERWDGQAWQLQVAASPPGATRSELLAVSCAASDACQATGFYASLLVSGATLAEGWDGHVWSVQPTPNPAGGLAPVLYGVDCATATRCQAVGTQLVAPTEFAFAEGLSGG